MAERLIAAVLKTVGLHGPRGSNPLSSAIDKKTSEIFLRGFLFYGKKRGFEHRISSNKYLASRIDILIKKQLH